MKNFKLLFLIVLSVLLSACQQEEINSLSQLKSIEITTGDLELTVGDSEVLDVILNPDIDYPGLEIEWTTDNENVATISRLGILKAVGPGTAYIDAKVKGTNISTYIEVKVKAKEIKYTSVELRGVYINSIPLTNPETNMPWDEDSAPDVFVGIYDSMIQGTTFDSRLKDITDFSSIPGWTIAENVLVYSPVQTIQIRVFDSDDDEFWFTSDVIGNINFNFNKLKGQTEATGKDGDLAVTIQLKWNE